MDSPDDEDQIRCSVAAANGKPSLPCSPRETPTQARAAELGFKIGTFKTAMLGATAAAIENVLSALKEGRSQDNNAMAPANFHKIFGYAVY